MGWQFETECEGNNCENELIGLAGQESQTL